MPSKPGRRKDGRVEITKEDEGGPSDFRYNPQVS